jgi:hypothetical protein
MRPPTEAASYSVRIIAEPSDRDDGPSDDVPQIDVLLRGNRLQITAEVDAAGLQTLKEMIGKYEEILKLLAPKTRTQDSHPRNERGRQLRVASLLGCAALLTRQRLISIELAGKSRPALGQIFQNLGFILIRRQFHQPKTFCRLVSAVLCTVHGQYSSVT